MSRPSRNRKPILAGSVLACCLGLHALPTPFAAANVITGTQNWEIVSRLTGPDLTGHVGIGGTDLGHSVNHNGKTYFLFGDTFASEASAGSGGPDWRQNVMAWSTDTNPADGVTFDGWITRPDGTAKQVITPGTDPVTYIPTGAISVGDKIYSWYMHVSDWDGWTLSHAGLASWQEGDSQFSVVPDFQFPGSTAQGTQGGNFGMVAASKRSPLENVGDGHIYLWGTGGGRLGGVKLARVLPRHIENQSAYQYFNGEVNGVPQWTTSEFDAPLIIDDTVGEMSVMYNEALGAWTLMYQNGASGAFEIRQSDTPWGEWSEPTTVTHFSQAPGLYAPYMNPLYTENDGQTLYFTMSLWDPYDVYLAKVDLDIDLQTRWNGAAGDWASSTWTHGTPDAQRRAVLDNGGTIRLTTVESARLVDVGTRADHGGTLEITDGGHLTIHEGGLRLGQVEGATGHLDMDGGSVDITGGFNMFLVGDHGDATASISGGSISARAFGIGLQPTSTGHVDLGGDAVITTTGDRFVMGMIRNTATGERPTASMNMTGGTISVTAGATGLPDAVIGFDGVADLEMSGGTINVDGLFVAAVAGASGSAPASEATINHSGGTINASRMVLAENGVGDYTLSGTGQINVDKRLVLAWREPSQSSLVQTGGSINVDNGNSAVEGVGLVVGDQGLAAYTLEGGALNVPRHARIANGAGSVGRMAVDGGAVTVGGNLTVGLAGDGALTQTGGDVSVGGTLQVASGLSGSRGVVNLRGETLWATAIRNQDGGAFNFTGGTLHVGTFDGNLTNAGGALAPGNSAGLTHITGSYAQQSPATLSIEIGGHSIGNDYDSVTIGGQATLDGTLELALTDGFTPGYGDTFTVLNAAGVNGVFSQIDGVLPGDAASGGPLALATYYDVDSVEVLATIPGDADGDLSVDFFDFLNLRANYGMAGTWIDGDFDGDGDVDFFDFLLLRANYGTAAGGMGDGSGYDQLLAFESSIPEPSGAAALAGLAAGLGLRRRRRRRRKH